MVVSARVSSRGSAQLLDKLLELTPEEPPPAAAEDLPVGGEAPAQVRVEREEGVAVRVEDGVYVVSCRQAERIAPMVRFANWRARLQFHNELERTRRNRGAGEGGRGLGRHGVDRRPGAGVGLT